MCDVIRAIQSRGSAAQAVGVKWRDERAGSLGDMGCFSFFPSKNLGALGDGGMVTISSESLAKRLSSLREHGGGGYLHCEVGTNSRLDALQGGFLRVKLRRLEKWHQGRRRNAEAYNEAFSTLGEVTTPVIDPRAWSIFNQYTLMAMDRDGLLNHFRSREIGCAVYYPLPLHLQEYFRHLEYRKGDFPVSEDCSGKAISLPVFGELREDERNEVIKAVVEFYRG